MNTAGPLNCRYEVPRKWKTYQNLRFTFNIFCTIRFNLFEGYILWFSRLLPVDCMLVADVVIGQRVLVLWKRLVGWILWLWTLSVLKVNQADFITFKKLSQRRWAVVFMTDTASVKMPTSMKIFNLMKLSSRNSELKQHSISRNRVCFINHSYNLRHCTRYWHQIWPHSRYILWTEIFVSVEKRQMTK